MTTGDDAPSDGDLDVDALVEQLRARVAARRREGRYPPDLEHDLDGHFARIGGHRPVPYDDSALRSLVAALGQANFSAADIAYDSSVPGGAALHRTVGRIVGRQTQAVLEQMQRFADATRAVVAELVVAVSDAGSHIHADLLGQIDALMEDVAAFDAASPDSAIAVGILQERIEELEAWRARQEFHPWFAWDRFEDAFRGSEEELEGRHSYLVEELRECGDVVDLGCGRGEVVRILAGAGLDVVGVEVDADLARAGSARGLPIVNRDALSWLRDAADASLGAITAIQLVEHLTPQETVELVALAKEKVRRGGKVVLETPNPQSLYVFAHAFSLDPTHLRLLHPAYLTFLLNEAGFRDVRIEWRSPPAAEERLLPIAGESDAVDTMNSNVERLNRLLFAPQDFAVIGVA